MANLVYGCARTAFRCITSTASLCHTPALRCRGIEDPIATTQPLAHMDLRLPQWHCQAFGPRCPFTHCQRAARPQVKVALARVAEDMGPVTVLFYNPAAHSWGDVLSIPPEVIADNMSHQVTGAKITR